MGSYSVSDLEIQALVDNELSEKEKSRIHSMIKNLLWAQQRYDDLVNQKKLLQLWWNNSTDH